MNWNQCNAFDWKWQTNSAVANDKDEKANMRKEDICHNLKKEDGNLGYLGYSI